jgi:cephalosporin-C deacetylase
LWLFNREYFRSVADMPAFDLSLDELKNYGGSSPRPDDFEAYWDAALLELEGHDPRVELIPNYTISAPQAACFDLWFTGLGGARIYAKYVRPKPSAVAGPAVLKFHGYSAASGDWVELLGFAGAGIAIAAMDCRGQGGRSEDVGGVAGTTLRGHIIRGLDDPDPTKLLFRSIFLDSALLARIVMSFDEVDATRMGTTGGSQGGALALACAALEPRIKRVAPVFPFLCDYRRIWTMDLAKNAFEELSYFLRRFDPRHERIDAIFTKLGYIDIQNLAPRVKAEVLMFTGLMDQICPPSSQFAAYNKLTAAKEMILYPDYGHEGLPGVDDRIFAFMSAL